MAIKAKKIMTGMHGIPKTQHKNTQSFFFKKNHWIQFWIKLQPKKHRKFFAKWIGISIEKSSTLHFEIPNSNWSIEASEWTLPKHNFTLHFKFETCFRYSFNATWPVTLPPTSRCIGRLSLVMPRKYWSKEVKKEKDCLVDT